MDAVLDFAERLDTARTIPAAWHATQAALLRLDVPWFHHAHVA